MLGRDWELIAARKFSSLLVPAVCHLEEEKKARFLDSVVLDSDICSSGMLALACCWQWQLLGRDWELLAARKFSSLLVPAEGPLEEEKKGRDLGSGLLDTDIGSSGMLASVGCWQWQLLGRVWELRAARNSRSVLVPAAPTACPCGQH